MSVAVWLTSDRLWLDCRARDLQPGDLCRLIIRDFRRPGRPVIRVDYRQVLSRELIGPNFDADSLVLEMAEAPDPRASG